MREKKLQCIVAFHTTTDAMAFEEIGRTSGLQGRIIPLPTVISAGCGLAWRENDENRELLRKILQEHHFKYDRIYELEI